MAGFGMGMDVRSGTELRRISSGLRQLSDGKQLRNAFSSELRAAAAPLVPAVRASIRAIPSKTGTGDLRAAMARATKLSVRTVGPRAAVSIAVDGTKMPAGKRALQSYMEGTKKPWRHPVYGNTEVWVSQQPHPYFYKVVRPLGATSRYAVNRVLNKTAKKIT